jgi:ABC-type Zn2+ transport system substrate-binding protein/surface adhesin
MKPCLCLGNAMDSVVSTYKKNGYNHIKFDNFNFLELVLSDRYDVKNSINFMVNDIDAHIGNIAPELNAGLVIMTKQQLMTTFVSHEFEGKRWTFNSSIINSNLPMAVAFRDVFEDSLMFFTTGKSKFDHVKSDSFHVEQTEISNITCYRIEVGQHERDMKYCKILEKLNDKLNPNEVIHDYYRADGCMFFRQNLTTVVVEDDKEVFLSNVVSKFQLKKDVELMDAEVLVMNKMKRVMDESDAAVEEAKKKFKNTKDYELDYKIEEVQQTYKVQSDQELAKHVFNILKSVQFNKSCYYKCRLENFKVIISNEINKLVANEYTVRLPKNPHFRTSFCEFLEKLFLSNVVSKFQLKKDVELMDAEDLVTKKMKRVMNESDAAVEEAKKNFKDTKDYELHYEIEKVQQTYKVQSDQELAKHVFNILKSVQFNKSCYYKCRLENFKVIISNEINKLVANEYTVRLPKNPHFRTSFCEFLEKLINNT